MEHYVYRITNTIVNLHYYGTRTAQVASEDLGIYYFSSSADKEFIQDQKDNSKNYKYKILRIYSTRERAIQLEIKLHNKFNVGINEKFYNRSKQTSVAWDTSGIKFSNERKLNISKRLKLKHPKGMLGKTHSDDTKIKISERTSKAKREASFPVYQYDLKGKFIREFEWAGETKEFFGVNSALANVVKAINEPHRKYKESLWRKEKLEMVEPYKRPKMVWYYLPENKHSIKVNENKPDYKKDIPKGYIQGWGRYK